VFCVGLNGHPGNLEAILERFAPHIHEVFAATPPTLLGSGRAGAIPLTLEDMASQAAFAHAHGVGYNALLNGLCLDGRQFRSDFQRQLDEFFAFLVEAGIDAVTITDTFVLQRAIAFRDASGSRLQVCVSSLCDVTDADAAKRFEDMGADRIILHQNANRDFHELAKICKTVSCEIELYANTGSLYKCPYRQVHRVFISHLSTLSPEDLAKPENRNWLKDNCIAMRKRDPLEIIKAPTIRPEDLGYYERMGIGLFKISARSMDTPWALRVLRAYVNRAYSGNLPDLCDTNLGEEMPRVPNKDLDGLLERLLSSGTSYEHTCLEFFREFGYLDDEGAVHGQ